MLRGIGNFSDSQLVTNIQLHVDDECTCLQHDKTLILPLHVK